MQTSHAKTVRRLAGSVAWNFGFICRELLCDRLNIPRFWQGNPVFILSAHSRKFLKKFRLLGRFHFPVPLTCSRRKNTMVVSISIVSMQGKEDSGQRT